MLGILYPNDQTGRGDGRISYTVKPLAGLASGTEITNRASIVFDWNDPIDRPLVLNTIDATPPTSQVDLLAETLHTLSFPVSWTGQDEENGSGIAGYDVYVSDNGGDYQLWLDDTTETSAAFTGEDGHTYAFYSTATDNVGHVEAAAAPGTSDTETTLVVPPRVESVLLSSSAWSGTFLEHLDSQGLGHPTIPGLGYRISGDDGQLDALPWTNIDTVSIVFSEDVNIAAEAFGLYGISVTDYSGSFGYDSVSFTATLTLPQPIEAEKLLLSLKGVTDLTGNPLDGDSQFRFDVLPGDVNLSGSVIGNDLVLVRNSLGTSSSIPGYSVFKDVSADGRIIGNDLILVRNRLGTAVPSGQPELPQGLMGGMPLSMALGGRVLTPQDVLRLGNFLYFNGQRPVPEGSENLPFPVELRRPTRSHRPNCARNVPGPKRGIPARAARFPGKSIGKSNTSCRSAQIAVVD